MRESTATQATVGDIPVVLVDADSASGLADMLQQFLQQTLADSPRKLRQARALSGCAVFRSAEDEAVSVRITFAGDHIELCDGAPASASAPSVTADFLTMAHLTAGQESPFALLMQRKLRTRFTLQQVPFLLRMLRFMRIETATPANTWQRWALAAAAGLAVAGGTYWYLAGRT